MKKLEQLLENNREWVAKMTSDDPEFFTRLAAQQSPEYLWIGCADSRVPANEIVNLAPGELFVHRNVSNIVVHTDLNCLSALQYAVEVLHVRHVIVCGHYGCGGVRAAFENAQLGLIDNWLRHVQDVNQKHAILLGGLPNDEARIDRLCELNVIEQVVHVAQTTILQDAWAKGQEVTIHGWIYALRDGRLRDLGMNVSSGKELRPAYENVIGAMR